MSLPDAIQKQVDAVAALEAQMAAPPSPAPVTDPPPPAEPTEKEPQQLNLPEMTFENPPAQPEPDDGKWETKYKVLQGKYNKEVPRLQEQLREQGDALNQLQMQLQQLTRVSPHGDFSSAANEVEITDEERDSYGDDLLDVIGKRAMQVVLPEIRRIETMLEEIRRGVVGVSHEVQLTAHEKFIQALDTQHKSWRTLNRDEGFLDWLEERDPFSGQLRKDLLAEAVASHSVDRAIAFFKGYEAEHGVRAEPREPAKRKAETSLEAMAAPGRRSAAPAPVPNDLPEIWLRKDIQAFYAAVNRGEYRGREAEFDRIEQSIAKAASLGNVR